MTPNEKKGRRRALHELPLTHERLVEVLIYEPDTGIFRWKVVMGRGRTQIGAVAGTKAPGYVTICIDGVLYRAHRLAWFYVHERWPAPTLDIDHRNGQIADNRFDNLIEKTCSGNRQNRVVASRRSMSGLLGVHWHKLRGKWNAKIMVNGKTTSLGLFDDPAAAHAAYMKKKAEIHLGFEASRL